MHDLAIIGAGAGGIACAKAALRSGLKTVLIEKSPDTFGGTCINTGCIPTKFFLDSSKQTKSWQGLVRQKNDIIQKIKTPLVSFLEKQGLKIVWGQAHFIDNNTLSVGSIVVKATNIIVACGSLARNIINDSRSVSLGELYTRPELPNKALVIGGGYIGIETVSLLNAFGKDVTLVEKEERILPFFDSYLANRLRIILEKKGIEIVTGRDLSDYVREDFDVVISAVGREPDTQGLKVENIGLELDRNGWIKPDDHMRTNIKNIYACGDITGKKLLAYIADYQGRICVDNIRGVLASEDYSEIPECVFSIPQLAKVGKLEQDADAAGIQYEVIKTNFLKFSSSYVYHDTEGFIKILIDKDQRIIGGAIISKSAGEMISIIALCVKSGLKSDDLRKLILVHPTLSEVVPLTIL